jgi:FkbM family methyltransferase
MTQQNFFLKILENIVRSNIYFFIFSRFITNLLFSKYIYETDFKILKILKNYHYFDNLKKPIIDIGANDGISYKTIRNFLCKTSIISFEPLKNNFKKLEILKNKDKNYKIHNCGLSNIKIKKKIYIPYFKKYPLSSFAGINKISIIYRLKISLFNKNLLKKINFKSENIKLKKLDDFNLNPSFIKIDIEGHEYECIMGALKTIKKNKPILLIEYDRNINKKINKILKKINYKSYYYDNKINYIKLHNKEKIFNIIYIPENIINLKKNNDYN